MGSNMGSHRRRRRFERSPAHGAFQLAHAFVAQLGAASFLRTRADEALLRDLDASFRSALVVVALSGLLLVLAIDFGTIFLVLNVAKVAVLAIVLILVRVLVLREIRPSDALVVLLPLGSNAQRSGPPARLDTRLTLFKLRADFFSLRSSRKLLMRSPIRRRENSFPPPLTLSPRATALARLAISFLSSRSPSLRLWFSLRVPDRRATRAMKRTDRACRRR